MLVIYILISVLVGFIIGVLHERNSEDTHPHNVYETIDTTSKYDPTEPIPERKYYKTKDRRFLKW